MVLNVYISFVGILMRIFPFFQNLAILFSEIVIFMITASICLSAQPRISAQPQILGLHCHAV